MDSAPVDYRNDEQPERDELVALYHSVGWSAYSSDPDSLLAAIQGSTFVATARVDGTLVGLARGLSDDVSIFYLQDLLVDPAHQRDGVGRALLDTCLARFEHVRQKVLLTDDEEHQHRLYRSAGYHDVAELTAVPLHAFVSIDNMDLS